MKIRFMKGKVQRRLMVDRPELLAPPVAPGPPRNFRAPGIVFLAGQVIRSRTRRSTCSAGHGRISMLCADRNARPSLEPDERERRGRVRG